MKDPFRLRKPPFYPLNYGDGSQRSASDVRDQNLSLADFMFPTPVLRTATLLSTAGGKRTYQLFCFQGKLIKGSATLKSKFSSKSRMSFSSTLWLFEAFD